jgi:hypothetical protein
MRRPRTINAVAPLWGYRSWPVGTCWQNPEGDRRYIPISKCAHTATVRAVQAQGWQQTDFFRSPDFAGEYVVILRDPVDRWQAGIDVYIGAELGGWDSLSDATWQALTDIWRVDPHTESQMLYLHGLPLRQIRAIDFHAPDWSLLGVEVPRGVDSRPHWRPRPRLEAFRQNRDLVLRCQRVYQQDYHLLSWLLGQSF